MAATPPALSPAWGRSLCPHSAPRQPFPYLKKHGGFPKKPHASRGSCQQDVPRDQCDKAGGGHRCQLCPLGSGDTPGSPCTYRETQAMSLGRGKMSWLVLLSCITCPLTLQRMRRLWTSAGTEGTRHSGGDTGMAAPPQRPPLGKTRVILGEFSACCLLCQPRVPIPVTSLSCPHRVPTCHGLLGDKGRPQGTEGVEGFPQQPLPPVAHLPVPGAHVVGHREPHDVVQGHRLLQGDNGDLIDPGGGHRAGKGQGQGVTSMCRPFFPMTAASSTSQSTCCGGNTGARLGCTGGTR